LIIDQLQLHTITDYDDRFPHAASPILAWHIRWGGKFIHFRYQL